MRVVEISRTKRCVEYFFEGHTCCRIYLDGSKEWFLNGQRHREDGPAIEWASGYKAWYINGKYQDETAL